MMRFKKPKPVFRKRPPQPQSISPVAGFPGVIAGFPEFWQKAHDYNPEFFRAAWDLVPLVNKFLQPPVRGSLAIVEYFLVAIAANSFGSLITLVLNGYGLDAVRIARGMYEAAVNAGYLKLHPTELDDYIDFHWIRQKKFYDYLRQKRPSDLARIPAKTISETHAEFARVAPRFQNRNGRLRDSWCKKNLRTRAEEVGLGELYPTFYTYASGIHHGDISGLVAQSAKNALKVEVAPSLDGVKDALMMGHNALLTVLDSLNEVAGLRMDKELSDAKNTFMKVWKR